jgi:hypothetical protein
MDENSILECLDSKSQEVEDIRKNVDITKDFLDFVKKIDSLPEVNKRSSEESRSLYEAVSESRVINTVGKQLEEFFGPPCKRAGKSIPLMLRLNPSVKYLGGIRKEQSFFRRGLKLGEFYGALWPWQTNPETITVHLGFCCDKMSDEDYNKLAKLVETALAEQRG